MESEMLKCPVEMILGMVSGKWKIMIFKALVTGKPVRFNQIQRHLKGVSAKVLREQLLELENDGIIRRTVYGEVPPRVEYSFTPAGLGILQAMMELRSYGSKLPNVDMKKCTQCGAFAVYDNLIDTEGYEQSAAN